MEDRLPTPELERDDKGYAILPNGDKIKSFPTTVYTAQDGKEVPIFSSHYIPNKEITKQ